MTRDALALLVQRPRSRAVIAAGEAWLAEQGITHGSAIAILIDVDRRWPGGLREFAASDCD